MKTLQNIKKDVGMTFQNYVCKKFKDDIKGVNIQSSIPTSFLHYRHSSVKKDAEMGLHIFTIKHLFTLFRSHCTEALLSASRHGPTPSF